LTDSHRPSLVTFIQTRAFLANWRRLGLDEDDLRALEVQIMAAPESGVVVQGTGGLRKVRFAAEGRGRGKRGSERVCYALFPSPGVVLLVTVYGKGEKADLTPAEKAAIKAELAEFAASLRRGGSG
jgi:hypothetical protein